MEDGMQEKLNELSLGEKLVLGGSLVFLIAALFFDWWSFDEGRVNYGHSLLSSPGAIYGLIAFVIVLAMAGILLAMKFGNVNMPALPVGWTWGMAYGAASAVLVVAVLLKAWRISSGEVTIGGVTDDASLGGFGIGFFLGVIATAAIAYGGFLLYSADKGGGFASLRGQR
jgi:hypothetical protein